MGQGEDRAQVERQAYGKGSERLLFHIEQNLCRDVKIPFRPHATSCLKRHHALVEGALGYLGYPWSRQKIVKRLYKSIWEQERKC